MSVKHGTYYGYIRGECRCDDCRKACSEYRRKWRLDMGPPEQNAKLTHGSSSTYKNYGCRCRPCVEAATRQQAAYRAVRKANIERSRLLGLSDD